MNIPEKFYVVRRMVNAEEITGQMIIADKEHTKEFQKKKERAEYYKTNLPSIYVDNKPKTGFVMVTAQSRYYSKNPVWRVLHPEGFEFDISAENMCDLLATNTMINGEFQNELFFTSNYALVNNNTKLYAKMVKEEEAKDKRKETASSLESGMGFVYNKNDYVYIGRLSAICVNKNKDLTSSEKSSLYHVVQNINTGNYFLRTKMDDKAITLALKNNKKINIKTELENINAQYQNVSTRATISDGLYDYNIPLFVNDKSFKKEKLVIEYEMHPTSSLSKVYHNMIYLNVSKSERIFGSREKYSSNSYYYSNDCQFEESFNFATLCTFPVQVQDNGFPSIEVDLSEHRSFGQWHYSSPFNNPSSTRTRDGYTMTFVNKPEYVLVGKYKIGE